MMFFREKEIINEEVGAGMWIWGSGVWIHSSRRASGAAVWPLACQIGPHSVIRSHRPCIKG